METRKLRREERGREREEEEGEGFSVCPLTSRPRLEVWQVRMKTSGGWGPGELSGIRIMRSGGGAPTCLALIPAGV